MKKTNKKVKKPAASSKAKKPVKKVAKKKPAVVKKSTKDNETGAKIANLLKNTLVGQSPFQKPAVQTVKMDAPKKPVMSSGFISASEYRPTNKLAAAVAPKSRFLAAGI